MTSHHSLSSYSYGKDDVRILRVVRSPNDPSSHQLVEYRIRCLLGGRELERSYTRGDNSIVVATDTIKNTLNLLAKRTPGEQVLTPETFGLVVVEHFLRTYEHVEEVTLDIDMLKWSRIALEKPLATSSGQSSTLAPVQGSQQHQHSFIRDGNEKRFVHLLGKRDAQGAPTIGILQGGLRDLVVLKSSGSAFYGFWRDEYTTLKEVQDRIFSTSVDCSYTITLPSAVPLADLLSSTSTGVSLPPFDAIASAVSSHILTIFATHSSPSVQATMYQTGLKILDDPCASSVLTVDFAMPNRHYIPIDLSWAGEENLTETEAEVFLPSEHPSGLIKAAVTRGDGGGSANGTT